MLDQVGVSVSSCETSKRDVRTHYHPNYYGAYVLDPDGNNVEAVCHAPA